MRQATPLSPAVRLGAERILVIGVRNESPEPEPKPTDEIPHPNFGSIAGYMLDALLMDGLSSDLERLTRINLILDRVPGREIDGEFGKLRFIDALIMLPSRDVRDIALRHIHEMPKPVRLLMRGLGALNYGGRQLMSYLLFESGYTQELIQLGYEDAMDRRMELLSFMEGAPMGSPTGIIGWQDLSEEYSTAPAGTESFGIRLRLNRHVQVRNSVPSPRKAMKPTTSVTVVSTTVPASAGSMSILRRISGIAKPANAAVIRLITSAAAMTAPTAQLAEKQVDSHNRDDAGPAQAIEQANSHFLDQQRAGIGILHATECHAADHQCQRLAAGDPAHARDDRHQHGENHDLFQRRLEQRDDCGRDERGCKVYAEPDRAPLSAGYDRARTCRLPRPGRPC